MLVYELVRHRNAVSPTPLVPGSVIERAPSAELRPGQLDADSLPPYEVLDEILAAYVEGAPARATRSSPPGPTRPWSTRSCVWSTAREYKRRQAPPGIRSQPRRSSARPAAVDHQLVRRLAWPRPHRDRHPIIAQSRPSRR